MSNGYDEVRRQLYSEPAMGFTVSTTRRLFGTATLVTPGSGEIDLFFPEALHPTDAILLESAMAEFNPAAPGITLQSVDLAIAPNATTATIEPVGQATLTTLALGSPTIATFPPAPLISFVELTEFARKVGILFTQPLRWILRFSGSGAGTLHVNFWVRYRLVSGLQEG